MASSYSSGTPLFEFWNCWVSILRFFANYWNLVVTFGHDITPSYDLPFPVSLRINFIHCHPFVVIICFLLGFSLAPVFLSYLIITVCSTVVWVLSSLVSFTTVSFCHFSNKMFQSSVGWYDYNPAG